MTTTYDRETLLKILNNSLKDGQHRIIVMLSREGQISVNAYPHPEGEPIESHTGREYPGGKVIDDFVPEKTLTLLDVAKMGGKA